jgi:hypothetical protein
MFFRVLSYFYAAVAYLGWLYGFIMIAGLPKNKYEWMAEEDPTAKIPMDPSADERVLYVTLLLIGITIAQLVIVVAGKRTWVRILSGVLVTLALIVWAARFIV